MLERKRRETEISQAITKAIQEKSFKVYYQPIYSVAENKYTKMEALIRLIDENLGFIPPDEFIPLAEKNGDILVQKAPACTIQTQAEAVCRIFGANADDIKVIGIRHGEKMYETLLTNEECAKAEDMGNFYRVPADNRTLNYDKYFTEGDLNRVTLTEFNSDNTVRLDLEQTIARIVSLEYIQQELSSQLKSGIK